MYFFKNSVRFICPAGEVIGSDFPPACLDRGKWTPWFDRSNPTGADGADNEELKHLRHERPDEICDIPLYMQAQTVDEIPARETGDVFDIFDARRGLICIGKHQESGRCQAEFKIVCCLKYYAANVSPVKCNFWPKFRFFPDFRFLSKTSIFEQNLYCSPKCGCYKKQNILNTYVRITAFDFSARSVLSVKNEYWHERYRIIMTKVCWTGRRGSLSMIPHLMVMLNTWR